MCQSKLAYCLITWLNQAYKIEALWSLNYLSFNSVRMLHSFAIIGFLTLQVCLSPLKMFYFVYRCINTQELVNRYVCSKYIWIPSQKVSFIKQGILGVISIKLSVICINYFRTDWVYDESGEPIMEIWPRGDHKKLLNRASWQKSF